MKTIFLAAIAVLTMATTASADKVFICLDSEIKLSFVIYEDSDGVSRGQMNLNNMQIANMDAQRVNDIAFRATVRGNAANTEFTLNTDREAVYVSVNGDSEKVCSAMVILN